jgi:hypothetical protein
MKKISGLIVVLMIFGITNPLLAGKKKQFTGKITYTISYEGKQVAGAAEGMLPTTMTIYIGDGFKKDVLFTSMGKQIVICNLENKSKTTLIDLMGQQFAIESSFEEIQKENEHKPDAELEYNDETKEIAGYQCKKLIVRFKNDEGKTTSENIAWFTEELLVGPDLNFDQKFFQDIEGVLMEFELDMEQGMKMKFMATEVEKKKVPAKDFEIPASYKKVTREELMNSLGG